MCTDTRRWLFSGPYVCASSPMTPFRVVVDTNLKVGKIAVKPPNQEDKMQLQKLLRSDETDALKLRVKSLEKAFVGVFLSALFMAHTTDAVAACGATVNGKAMTVTECRLARQIYGDVVPGDYLRDARGNWVKIGDPSVRGNIYRDAQRARSSNGSGRSSNAGGLTRTPFGSVGGGYFYDNETGASVGP